MDGSSCTLSCHPQVDTTDTSPPGRCMAYTSGSLSMGTQLTILKIFYLVFPFNFIYVYFESYMYLSNLCWTSHRLAAHLRLMTMTPATMHARRGSACSRAAVQNTLIASSATTAVLATAFTLHRPGNMRRLRALRTAWSCLKLGCAPDDAPEGSTNTASTSVGGKSRVAAHQANKSH